MGEQICPKCGKKGSLQEKMVKNQQGKTYHYLYYAHYSGLKGETRKVKWCYIGKETPKGDIKNAEQS